MEPVDLHKTLRGAVDLHCHSGPNPLAREFDHVEAGRDAARLEMRGVLVKSHHHNTVMDLLAMKERVGAQPTALFGGIALNSWVGGINPCAVAMSLRMGGRAVWFPTLSSRRHLEHGPGRNPTQTVELPNRPVDIRGADGALTDDVLQVLDLIAESDALLSSGHLGLDDARELFTEARRRGVRRMVMSHPWHVIDASPRQCLELCELGVFIEHEVGAFDPKNRFRMDPDLLYDWIRTLGPTNTVLASDLGQKGRPRPVDSFLRVCALMVDRGLGAAELRRMACDNPAFLLGLDRRDPGPWPSRPRRPLPRHPDSRANRGDMARTTGRADTDGLAAYYPFDLARPDVSDGGVDRWYGPATNFVVETLRATPGRPIDTGDNPDEYVIVLPEGSPRVRIAAGGAEVTADENSVVVVPPGDSRMELRSDGLVHRVFSCLSPVHAAARRFTRQPMGAADTVVPLSPASAPPSGYALRHYRFDDFDVPRPKWTFRTGNLMVAVIGPMTTPRGRNLSPHLHEDFEQASLVTQGDYVHHIRRAWGDDVALWKDDEHVRIGAPSVTVISPPDLHTSQTVGTGPFVHVDVFSPPRVDFMESGQVLNMDDYPWSPDGGTR